MMGAFTRFIKRKGNGGCLCVCGSVVPSGAGEVCDALNSSQFVMVKKREEETEGGREV